MKILITLLNFNALTGSELWAYELSKELVKQGQDVTILSTLKENTLANKNRENGVKCYDFQMPPKDKFDIIIASHQAVIESIIKNNLYANTPIISVNHSEVISMEYPVKNKAGDYRIRKYVAVRQGIADMLENKFGIHSEDVTIIHNPIDRERFKITSKSPDSKTVLFVGTIDYLRKDTIIDLIQKSKTEGFKIIIVGKNNSNWFSEYMFDPNIEYHSEDDKIEKYYQRATHTASVLMGRTEIEGWFCGLPCYEYEIDMHGIIKNMDKREPLEDLSIFYPENVAKRYMSIVNNIVNNSEKAIKI